MIIQKLFYDNKVYVKKSGFLLIEIVVCLAIFMIVGFVSFSCLVQFREKEQVLTQRLMVALTSYTRACKVMTGIPLDESDQWYDSTNRNKSSLAIKGKA